MLVRTPAISEVSLEMISRQKTFVAALDLAIRSSGLEDKEIYIPLKIDAGHWSRIRKGDAHFPDEIYSDFCEIVGNNVIIEWHAYRRGLGTVMLKSEAERRAEEAERRAEEAEKKLEWALEVIDRARNAK